MTRQYIDNKHLNVFVSTRRTPGSTNICNLWTEEVTYETELTFPTLMNVAEIKESSTIRISPIRNAIKSLLEKNSELRGLEFWIKHNLKEGIDPKSISSTAVFGNLSRALAGTVDSPVNGGVGQYRAFFTASSTEPDYKENVAFLKSCFSDLIILLDKLLKLHQILLPSNLAPQHSAMVELFAKNFRDEITELRLDIGATLDLNTFVDKLVKVNIRTRRDRQNAADSELDYLLNVSGSRDTRSDDTSSFNGSLSNDSFFSGGSNFKRASSLGTSFLSSSFATNKRTVLNYRV
ncbi:unnamed protein product [Ambrosiozyma monospora]|uniref:Unnamed protein product n=1 Tax=Ambrosiozyma monospora TaxID=43982 RepID=A0ACB5T649_AMBMO|nr:unnamed protein product [Ambrosiozyma monospora]